MSATNGVAEQAAPTAPAWAQSVPSAAIIEGLQQVVANQATQIVAMELYISQLHQALAAMSSSSSVEEDHAPSPH